MKTYYYNGAILTMEETLFAQAVLVEDGTIVAVGDETDVGELAKGARRVDLLGAAMLPAFIDAHSHFSGYANSLLQVPLEEVVSFEELKGKIRDYIEKNQIPEGKWVMAKGFDPETVEEGTYPGRHVLDEAAPNHPVLVQHKSGHMGVMNTKGLEVCHITAQTASPEGGRIEVKDGALTGYLEENAMIQSMEAIGMPTKEELKEAYRKAQECYASHGITTVQEGMTPDQMVPLYQMLLGQRMLYLDLVAYADMKNSRKLMETFSDRIGTYKDHIKIGGYKIFLDGSPQGRTAWMREPYKDSKDYRGYPTMTDEAVYQAVGRAVREGMQILAHCNGDAACDQYIRMCKNVKEEGGSLKAIRPVLIHGQLLGLDQLDAVKELSLLPSFFVAHVYHWGDTHIKNFGKERADSISPAGSALKKGIRFTFHQDAPVIEPDMLETVWCAVNRKTKSGVTLGESEKISVLDALKAVTIHAAYQYFEENEKGSIKPGKHADFVILDQNPLEVLPEKIREIKVLQTIKDGAVIYRRESPASRIQH